MLGLGFGGFCWFWCVWFFLTRETAWKGKPPAVPGGPRLFQELTLSPSTGSVPGPYSPVTAENLQHQAAVNIIINSQNYLAHLLSVVKIFLEINFRF